MSARKRTLAIIPSAGMGRRMGSKRKNYLALNGSPVLAHTLAPFEASALIDSIVVVVPPSDEDFCRREIVERHGFKKIKKIVAGGSERQYSVGNGLKEASGYDIVVVHDGARPLVTVDIIEASVRAAVEHGAAVTAVPVKDTIKEALGGFVARTIPRESLVSVQTPQAFRIDILRRAFKKAEEDGFLGTDESALVERTGVEVMVVEGSYENMKITTEVDLVIAECVLKKRAPS